MKKLNILVCDKYVVEVEKAVEVINYEDVMVKPYPCLCEFKGNQSATQQLLKQPDIKNNDTIVLCGSHCKILKLSLPEVGFYRNYVGDYCFSHLAYKQFIEYIIEKGGYIISSGWLNNWRERLKKDGFDREIGQKFYQGFCTELVFLDPGSDIQAQDKLKDLSDYLAIPYRVIPIELESLQYFLKSAICEWRLSQKNEDNTETINELKKQNSEYASILSLMEQVSNAENQREVIEKLKTVFLVVFGAQKCNYWVAKSDISDYPEEIRDIISNPKMMHYFSKCKSRFLVKLEYENELFGVLEVGDFLFPQHSEKYLNLSIAVVKVSALVLSNVKKYELLISSRNELEYTSFHDSLTGLYNRTYFNKVSKQHFHKTPVAVFVCDIDGLKNVNDSLGHAEGDRFICMAADVLKSCFRETDIIARIGGDEFAIIVSECDVKMAQILNTRIDEAILKSNQNNDLQLGISIGYALSDNNHDDFETLIKRADKLMYEDKAKNVALSPNSVRNC